MENTSTNDVKNNSFSKRTFFVIREIVSVSSNNNKYITVVNGTVHGTVEYDDVVYLVQPKGSIIRTHIKNVRINGEIVHMGMDQDVQLTIETNDENIELYSVISSISPKYISDEIKRTENSLIASLLYEAKNLVKDKKYMNWLMFCIAHGKFITPISGQDNINKKTKMDENVKYKTTLYNVSTCKDKDSDLLYMISMPNNEQRKVLVVYTDWNELKKWSALFENRKEEVKIKIIELQDIMEVLRKVPLIYGIVINPYSENQICINRQLIEQTLQIAKMNKRNKDKNIK